MTWDPICVACGEPKSAHVKTDQGPYTHPREARGEGHYVMVRQGYAVAGYAPGDLTYVNAQWAFRPATPAVDDGGSWEEEAG